MKGFFSRIGKREIFLAIIYIILALVFAIFFPKLASFKNPYLENLFQNAKWVKPLQVILFVLMLLFPLIFNIASGGTLVSKVNTKYGDQGTAKEGKISELNDLRGNDGFTLSKSFRLSANKSYEHVAIIGPTGSGKSTSFFIPNLLDLDGVHSAVVTDPKGELHELTSPYLKSLGYNIIKLSPLEMSENDLYYNPLFIAKDGTEIREMAQLIMTNGNKSVELATGSSSGGAEWLNMATPLLSATLAYVKEKGERKTINEALDIILKDDLKMMEKRFESVPSALRSFLIFKSSAGSEKTLSSIKSVLTTNMQLFVDEKIEDFTQTPFIKNALGEKVVDKRKMFNPNVLREKPTVLFVCVPELKSLYVMPLMSVFYSQLLDKCMMNNTGQPILFMLDEFANIGVIPSISNITATARSRRIGISIGLQGVEQLRRNYGEENASDILNNLKTKVIFSGLTGDSAQYVSDLAGFTTVESKNYSKNPSGGDGLFGNTSVSKSGVRRELITADEVRRMDENEVLIIAHNKNLVRDQKNVYYKQRRYISKIK